MLPGEYLAALKGGKSFHLSEPIIYFSQLEVIPSDAKPPIVRKKEEMAHIDRKVLDLFIGCSLYIIP